MKDMAGAERALINADRAGDVEAAKKLAQYIKSQRAPSLGSRLEQRGVNIGRELIDTNKPVTTLPYRYATQVAGGAGDILGAAASAVTPDFIEEPVKKYAGQAMEYVAGTRPAQAIAKGYGYAKEKAPNVMDTLEGAASMYGMTTGGQALGRAGLKGLQKTESAVNIKKTYPTKEEIKTASTGLYKQAEELGASFTPKVIDDLYEAGSKELPKGNVSKKHIPLDEADTFTQSLEKSKGAASTLDDFEDFDKHLGGRAAATYMSDPALSRKLSTMQGELRDAVQNPANVSGSTKGIEAHREATRLWSIKKKVDDIDRAIEVGLDHEAPATGIKNQFKRIKHNPKLMSGYSKAEKAAISKAATTGELEGIVKAFGSRLNIIGGLATGGAGGSLGMMGVSTAGRKGSELYKLMQANKVMKSLGERSGLAKETRRIDPKAAYKKAEQKFKGRKGGSK